MKTAEEVNQPFQTLFKASLTYAGLVFASGFILGVIRALFVAPVLGTRAAELSELPLMILISYFAARYVVNRFRTYLLRECVHIGLLALLMMVILELSLAVLIQGLSFGEYLAGRDPVSGLAYLFSLLLFATIPALLSRRKTPE